MGDLGWAGRAGLGALAVAYGWWVTGLARFSAGATVAVLGAGLVAALAGFVRPVRRRAQRRSVDVGSVVAWLTLVTTLAAWQLIAYFGSPRSQHPTLSSLANTALDPRPLRAVAFAAWLAGAAWLAR